MVYFETVNLTKFNLSVLTKRGLLIVYIYSKNYICIMESSKFFPIKLCNAKVLKIASCKGGNFNINIYINQFNKSNFTKIKFKGKGYKIKKNSSKSVILLFNRAHITIL
jgi:hypothetical protein